MLHVYIMIPSLISSPSLLPFLSADLSAPSPHPHISGCFKEVPFLGYVPYLALVQFICVIIGECWVLSRQL